MRATADQVFLVPESQLEVVPHRPAADALVVRHLLVEEAEVACRLDVPGRRPQQVEVEVVGGPEVESQAAGCDAVFVPTALEMYPPRGNATPRPDVDISVDPGPMAPHSHAGGEGAHTH